GTYALSNTLLDTPWYKVTKIKAEFLRLRDPITPGQLFPIFADNSPAPDAEVQQTGLAPAIEKGLSSPFIRLPGYGTRVTSVLQFRRNGEIEFCERTFRRGQPRGDQRFVFKVQN
ncbi:MAG TPA: NRDE family protein, partial [Turneriella sp.]|nr:NRDE family protein [Turneriella sp.]